MKRIIIPIFVLSAVFSVSAMAGDYRPSCSPADIRRCERNPGACNPSCEDGGAIKTGFSSEQGDEEVEEPSDLPAGAQEA